MYEMQTDIKVLGCLSCMRLEFSCVCRVLTFFRSSEHICDVIERAGGKHCEEEVRGGGSLGVLMSVNSIHSLDHNITCQTTILESTEVLMMYRCTNVSLSISVFNVADHKQLSRWYTRCDV